MTARTRLAHLVGFDNDILKEVDDAIADLFSGGRSNDILNVVDGDVIAPDAPSSVQCTDPIEGEDVTIFLPTVFNDRPTFWIKQSGNGHLVIDSTRASGLRAGSKHEAIMLVARGVNDSFTFTPAGGSLISYLVPPGVYESVHDLLDAATSSGADFLSLVNVYGDQPEEHAYFVLADLDTADGSVLHGAGLLELLGFDDGDTFDGAGSSAIDDQSILVLNQWESIVVQWDGSTWIRWAWFTPLATLGDADPHVVGRMWWNDDVLTRSTG